MIFTVSFTVPFTMSFTVPSVVPILVVSKSAAVESGPTFVVDISFRGKLQYRYSAQM